MNSGMVQLLKRSTHEMLADMMTKPLAAAEIKKFMAGMNYHFRPGRHRLALGA